MGLDRRMPVDRVPQPFATSQRAARLVLVRWCWQGLAAPDRPCGLSLITSTELYIRGVSFALIRVKPATRSAAEAGGPERIAGR